MIKKIILMSSIVCTGFGANTFAQAPTPVGLVPNERQVEWYNREIIAFFHFGINTFEDDVNEGDGKASPAIFNPTELDCNQWIRVLKSAGIPSGILVAKHADGFCNWPSKYTDYSVKNSPWKDGKGDVVKEFMEACKTAGIKAGVYLGPHDRHEKTYGTPAYADYYANQLSELLRNYGAIWEMWWDGAGADFLTSDFYTRWADTVRTLQPDCVIFGTKNSSAFADCRWVGNESGIAGDPCWSTINLSSIRDESLHINELNHGEVDGTAYVPAESDVSIRPSWFYHSSEDEQVKSVETLCDIYCNSVGHNSVLLLNFGPERRGLINAIDSANAARLKSLIDDTFKTNLASGSVITALHPRGEGYNPSYLVDNRGNTYYASADEFKTDTLIFNLGSEKIFDLLMLQEVIELGHRTTGWSVDYSPDGSNWKPIPEATGKQSIGYKWIVRFKPVTASQIRLSITSGKACTAIHSFGIYKQPETVNSN
ncbi:MAG: alpha-L-fucosidase 1 [Ignavibacteria bacterium GWB2_35_6b]|nr:MAG: alpha-L-fucosidase 1 [Ignavibacteria bacterium GWB2_35_6b]